MVPAQSEPVWSFLCLYIVSPKYVTSNGKVEDGALLCRPSGSVLRPWNQDPKGWRSRHFLFKDKGHLIGRTQ